MTADEREELIQDGWQPAIIDELAARGFRPCKPDIVSARFESSIGITCGFLRQTSTPHLYITVRQDAFIEVVREQIDTAIYDAGWSAGADHIATFFQRFQDAVKRPRRPSETEASIEQRLAVLESHLAKLTPPAAERERCAQIAEAVGQEERPGAYTLCDVVAERIRYQSNPPNDELADKRA